MKLQKNLFQGPGRITQRFGENPAAYEKFGLKGHNGIDYGIRYVPLYCCIFGKVTENAYDKYGYGHYIKIENEVCGVIYAHFKDPAVKKVGDEVKPGEELGLSGNSGNSTGPHLHFGVFPKPRDRSNGYLGYIDPLGDDVEWVDSFDDVDHSGCVPIDDFIEMKRQRQDKDDKFEECKENRMKEGRIASQTIEKQQKLISTANEQLTLCTKRTKDLEIENERLRNESGTSGDDFKEELEKKDKSIEILEGLLEIKENTIDNLTAKVDELRGIIKEYQREVKTVSKEALFKALKELGRYLLFGVIGFAISYLTSESIGQTETVAVVVAILRFADKYLHERAKDKAEVRIKGISPF